MKDSTLWWKMNTLMEITKENIQIYHTCYLDMLGSFIARDFMSKHGMNWPLHAMRNVWYGQTFRLALIVWKILSDGKGKEFDPTVASLPWMDVCSLRRGSDYRNEWICKGSFLCSEIMEDPQMLYEAYN